MVFHAAFITEGLFSVSDFARIGGIYLYDESSFFEFGEAVFGELLFFDVFFLEAHLLYHHFSAFVACFSDYFYVDVSEDVFLHFAGHALSYDLVKLWYSPQ